MSALEARIREQRERMLAARRKLVGTKPAVPARHPDTAHFDQDAHPAQRSDSTVRPVGLRAEARARELRGDSPRSALRNSSSTPRGSVRFADEVPDPETAPSSRPSATHQGGGGGSEREAPSEVVQALRRDLDDMRKDLEEREALIQDTIEVQQRMAASLAQAQERERVANERAASLVAQLRRTTAQPQTHRQQPSRRHHFDESDEASGDDEGEDNEADAADVEEDGREDDSMDGRGAPAAARRGAPDENGEHPGKRSERGDSAPLRARLDAVEGELSEARSLAERRGEEVRRARAEAQSLREATEAAEAAEVEAREYAHQADVAARDASAQIAELRDALEGARMELAAREGELDSAYALLAEIGRRVVSGPAAMAAVGVPTTLTNAEEARAFVRSGATLPPVPPPPPSPEPDMDGGDDDDDHGDNDRGHARTRAGLGHAAGTSIIPAPPNGGGGSTSSAEPWASQARLREVTMRAREEADELRALCGVRDVELMALARTLQEREAAAADAMRRVQAVEARCTSLEDEVFDARKQLREHEVQAQRRVRMAEAEAEVARSAAARREEECATARRRMETLQRQVKALEEELVQARSVRDSEAATRQRRDAQQAMAAAAASLVQHETTALRARADEARAHADELRAQLEEERARAERAEAETSELREELARAREDLHHQHQQLQLAATTGGRGRFSRGGVSSNEGRGVPTRLLDDSVDMRADAAEPADVDDDHDGERGAGHRDFAHDSHEGGYAGGGDEGDDDDDDERGGAPPSAFPARARTHQRASSRTTSSSDDALLVRLESTTAQADALRQQLSEERQRAEARDMEVAERLNSAEREARDAGEAVKVLLQERQQLQMALSVKNAEMAMLKAKSASGAAGGAAPAARTAGVVVGGGLGAHSVPGSSRVVPAHEAPAALSLAPAPASLSARTAAARHSPAAASATPTATDTRASARPLAGGLRRIAQNHNDDTSPIEAEATYGRAPPPPPPTAASVYSSTHNLGATMGSGGGGSSPLHRPVSTPPHTASSLRDRSALRSPPPSAASPIFPSPSGTHPPSPQHHPHHFQHHPQQFDMHQHTHHTHGDDLRRQRTGTSGSINSSGSVAAANTATTHSSERSSTARTAERTHAHTSSRMPGDTLRDAPHTATTARGAAIAAEPRAGGEQRAGGERRKQRAERTGDRSMTPTLEMLSCTPLSDHFSSPSSASSASSASSSASISAPASAHASAMRTQQRTIAPTAVAVIGPPLSPARDQDTHFIDSLARSSYVGGAAAATTTTTATIATTASATAAAAAAVAAAAAAAAAVSIGIDTPIAATTLSPSMQVHAPTAVPARLITFTIDLPDGSDVDLTVSEHCDPVAEARAFCVAHGLAPDAVQQLTAYIAEEVAAATSSSGAQEGASQGVAGGDGYEDDDDNDNDEVSSWHGDGAAAVTGYYSPGPGRAYGTVMPPPAYTPPSPTRG